MRVQIQPATAAVRVSRGLVRRTVEHGGGGRGWRVDFFNMVPCRRALAYNGALTARPGPPGGSTILAPPRVLRRLQIYRPDVQAAMWWAPMWCHCLNRNLPCGFSTPAARPLSARPSAVSAGTASSLVHHSTGPQILRHAPMEDGARSGGAPTTHAYHSLLWVKVGPASRVSALSAIWAAATRTVHGRGRPQYLAILPSASIGKGWSPAADSLLEQFSRPPVKRPAQCVGTLFFLSFISHPAGSVSQGHHLCPHRSVRCDDRCDMAILADPPRLRWFSFSSSL